MREVAATNSVHHGLSNCCGGWAAARACFVCGRVEVLSGADILIVTRGAMHAVMASSSDQRIELVVGRYSSQVKRISGRYGIFFKRGWAVQCISPVVIYRKCTQRTHTEKGGFWEKI